jgi:hypothetical protein
MINLMEIYPAFVIFTKNINFPTSLLREKSLKLLAIDKHRIRLTNYHLVNSYCTEREKRAQNLLAIVGD